ncbi:MAG: proline dehydrogenase [Chitinophagaceae bacterium]|nr:MAG: proline dehydrogenase [Chitinophagaceae bacterium]
MNKNTNNHPQFDPDNLEGAFGHLSNKDIKTRDRIFSLFNSKFLVKFGTSAVYKASRLGLPVSFFVPKKLYRLFVGGENLKQCAPLVIRLQKDKVFTILDYAVEAKSGEREYDKTLNENLDALAFGKKYPGLKVISAKISGLAENALLESIQKGEDLTENQKDKLKKVRQRLDKLALSASENNTGIFFDAEESWVQNPMDMLVDELMEKYNKEKVVVFNTYQLYRKDRLDFLKKSFQNAKEKNFLLGAKIVRGAYIEKENERAIKMGYPSPIHQSKSDTDNDYDAAIDFCLQNLKDISVCVATHNENSCKLALDLAQKYNIDLNHPHLFFSQLFGMGDHLTYNLANAGCNATKYIPYGPIKEAIPYLMRRIQENSSVEGQMGRELGLLKKEIKRRNI